MTTDEVVEVVPAALAGERLDRVVSMVAEVPRSRAASLLGEGAVRVNGEVVTRAAHRLEEGDELRVLAPALPEHRLVGDPSVVVPVLLEDADVLVVDKPADLVVHPGAGHAEGTLVHGLLARYPELAVVGDPARPGIVHRLDRGTSGLLVVARTATAYDALVRQLAARTVAREYDTLVWGWVEDLEGVVDAPIARSDRDPTRMAVRAGGRAARTRYTVVDRWREPGVSRLSCRLETGRTHQIRVHLAAIGHPVVGDQRYGGARPSLAVPRPFLHATRLAFDHPVSGERCEVRSPLPADLADVVQRLGPPDPP